MYSIHNLAHRAPATRTRVRWTPYGSLPSSNSSSSSTSKSPSSTCNSSPYSSAPSSPVSLPQCDPEPTKQIQSTPQPSQLPRDAQPREKNKFALGLVDQAVKTLCDIWRPQDIPQVFLTNSRPSGTDLHSSVNHSISVSNKLHSPIASTQTPPPSLFATSIHNNDCELPVGPSNLVPMKGFVHEVLRRSRTSGSVLQTALCYLEAVRPKITELIQQGEAFQPEPELADRITVATEAELAQEAEFCVGTDTIIIQPESDDSMDTIRISDTSYSGSTAVSSGGIIEDGESTLKKTKSPSPALSPLPPLPSPLLCPRRAFLASLILASKFTQDKCYSNRAWAKLSGLPPREVGRCERALGDALDWRLWVGKSSQSQGSSTTPSPVSNSRSLGRCRSESSIPSGPSESSSFLSGSTSSSDKRPLPISTPSVIPSISPERRLSSGAGLRRAATLPTESFAFNSNQVHSSTARAVAQWVHGRPLASDHPADATMCSPEKNSIGAFEQGFETERPKQEYSANSDLDITPTTPGLSYSPTSTESSSGDRTIQIPFCDENGGFSSIASLPSMPSESLTWYDDGPIAMTSMAHIVGAVQNSHLGSLPSLAVFGNGLDFHKHLSSGISPQSIFCQ